MVLVTKEELRNVANKRNINLDIYNDEALEDLILDAQVYIETETGRVFESTESYEMFNRFEGDSIALSNFPVISVTSVLLNGETIPPSAYTVNKKNAIIYLDTFSLGRLSYLTGAFKDDTVEVTYVAGYETPLRVARILCLDLIVASIKNQDNQTVGRISSMTENKLTVQYATTENDPSNIGERIFKLRRIKTNLI
jgi:hypothetical protein